MIANSTELSFTTVMIATLLVIPVLTFLFIALLPKGRLTSHQLESPLVDQTLKTIQKWQSLITNAIKLSAVLYFITVLAITALWITNDASDVISLTLGRYFSSADYAFDAMILIDRLSIVWLNLVALLYLVVTKFSCEYLNYDSGLKRFLLSLSLLLFGQTALAIAGGFDALMIGWEFIGLSSFFLIGFNYRNTSSVINAFKVFSVYRISDATLLASAWLSHILWHTGEQFLTLRSPEEIQKLLDHSSYGIHLLTVLLVVAAGAKSAQIPFSYWVSKALEGPTPSSAIFYGALSIHTGAFLLFRTQPLWLATTLGPVLVGIMGLGTAFAAGLISRTQSHIKGQIAYSSVAHVGIIFVELALGLNELALFHLIGNACLRCYQLLVSPSSMVYLLRHINRQASTLKHTQTLTIERFFPQWLQRYLYRFSLEEGYFESITRLILWRPVSMMGSAFQSRLLQNRFSQTLLYGVIFSLAGITLYNHLTSKMSVSELSLLALMLLSLFCSTAAITEKHSASRAWTHIALSLVLACVSILAVETDGDLDVLYYLSWVTALWILGLITLYMTHHLARRQRSDVSSLKNYKGYSSYFPRLNLLFLVVMLAVVGFPVSPIFFAQDALLHHAIDDYAWVAALMVVVFALNGMSGLRLYAKIFLGRPATH